MNKKQTYMKFLHLVEAVRGVSDFPELDAVEERVLNVFTSAWYRGQEITVLEAMKMIPDISESTVFRRIKSLRIKGLISLNIDEQDRRTRYIQPTELTNRYFAVMSGCIKKALKP